MTQRAGKPFYKDGICKGTLMVTPLGGRTEISVVCKNDKAGVYKGMLHGTKGSISLGHLLPQEQNERLELRLVLSRAQLEPIGTIAWGEALLSYGMTWEQDSFSGWEVESVPERIFRDPVLVKAARAQKQAWIQKKNGILFLAFPFWQKEFPLLPLFCFAEVKKLNKKLYAVFAFDQEGMPVLEEHRTRADEK